MKSTPILYSASMVLQILDDNKTNTRRILKSQPADILPMRGESRGKFWVTLRERKEDNNEQHGDIIRCKYGAPGDQLWVKESWRICGWKEGSDWMIQYKADMSEKWFDSVEEVSDDQTERWWTQCSDDCEKAGIPMDEDECYRFDDEHPCPTRWRPSIFMPKWASRITLGITNVRVERLQKMTDQDAISEGFKGIPEFITLWDQLNKKIGFGWDSNPWVWVVEFKRAK